MSDELEDYQRVILVMALGSDGFTDEDKVRILAKAFGWTVGRARSAIEKCFEDGLISKVVEPST